MNASIKYSVWLNQAASLFREVQFIKGTHLRRFWLRNMKSGPSFTRILLMSLVGPFQLRILWDFVCFLIPMSFISSIFLSQDGLLGWVTSFYDNPFPLLCAFYLLMFLSLPRWRFCASQCRFPSWNSSWVAHWSAYCFSSIHCSAGAGLPFGSGASSCNPAVVPAHGTTQAGAQLLPAGTDHLLPLLLLPYLIPFCSSLSDSLSSALSSPP